MDGLRLIQAAHEPGMSARPALLTEGNPIAYAELADHAERLAGDLTRAGVTPGERVALIAENRVETVIAVHALIELGATLVPIHPRLTPAEVDVVLADAAPARILREEELTARIAGAAKGSPLPPRCVDPEAPLAIVYTSGTSGRPKGAILSRRAFVASAAASALNLGWYEDDRWLLCMPLCHVGGLSILTRCLLARRPMILVPRFNPALVLAAIARDRATILSVVPTMLTALLEQDRGGILGRLRAVLLGGAAAPAVLLEECGRRGIPALTTYGLTEACSQVTAQRPRAPYRPEPGSGAPLAGVEIVIMGDDGASVPRGEVGRIRIRGPMLMSGYFRGPGKPPDPAVDAHGFFDPGDLGALDEEGRLHVHARRTDLIVTGGENVYPAEIEQCLESLPGVRRALVFGAPDERWGQVVACALELDPSSTESVGVEEALVAVLPARLAPHKRPRLFCAVDELPLTGSGKLDRGGAFERYRDRLRPLELPLDFARRGSFCT
jgi:O-succinylbenzoic acid--CoA ligase